MKPLHVWNGLALIAAIALGTGCQSPAAGAPTVGDSSKNLSIRNNGYSLLYQLLTEQKDISLLHFIKREHTDVRKLMTQIATSCGRGAKVLEQLAKEDPTVNLRDTALPPGEVAARDAIAATKKHLILGNKGSDFELNLLLTQTDALNYGWHLAEVTSRNEPQPEHARALADLAEELHNLYNAVSMQLLSKKW